MIPIFLIIKLNTGAKDAELIKQLKWEEFIELKNISKRQTIGGILQHLLHDLMTKWLKIV